MNPRHCLTCKRWIRDIDDKCVGDCEVGSAFIPARKIRFQFEHCDCGGYVFCENRDPHREIYHSQRMVELPVPMEVGR